MLNIAVLLNIKSLQKNSLFKLWILIIFHSLLKDYSSNSNQAQLKSYSLYKKKSYKFHYFLKREARRCEFHVHASSGATPTLAPVTGGPPTVTEDSIRGRRGRLLSPRHTLPPNTTCQWTFHGRPGTCKYFLPL